MTTTMRHTNRRQALTGIAALGGSSALNLGAGAASVLLAAPSSSAASVPTDVVTVMYQRESESAVGRLDPVVRQVTLTLERALKAGGLKVVQPPPEVYALLEQGPEAIITFATDAGLSLLFSSHSAMLPSPGQDAGTADVRLQARLFVGRHVLAAEESRGRMATRLEPAVREFGTRRAFELAAKEAGEAMAEKILEAVRDLTPDKVSSLVGNERTSSATATLVPVSNAPVGQPVAPPGLPSAAPPGGGTSAGTPAPGPAPLPQPANRYALIVAVSDYGPVRAATQSDISDLRGVAKDAALVESTLQQLGYRGSNVKVLKDQAATSAAVRSSIKELAARTGPDDTVVIFVSGHGADKSLTVSGFGMPILSDFRKGDGNAIDFFDLQSYVRGMRGRVIWISDTCHSGGAATNVASVVMSARGVSVRQNVRGPEALTVAGSAAVGQDFAILTACGPSEVSLETREGGLFTRTLFNELLRTEGRVPLAQVFQQSVAGTVVKESQQICRGSSACAGRPQQTPVMAVNGRGAQLLI